MATRKNNSKNPQEWAKVDFVYVEMDAETKKAFKKLSEEQIHDYYGKTIRMIENGYKMSVTYDQEHSTFICSLTCKDEKHDNFNLCMSSRSDNHIQAIALGSFKTIHCCTDGVWNGVERDFTFG